LSVSSRLRDLRARARDLFNGEDTEQMYSK